MIAFPQPIRIGTLAEALKDKLLLDMDIAVVHEASNLQLSCLAKFSQIIETVALVSNNMDDCFPMIEP